MGEGGGSGEEKGIETLLLLYLEGMKQCLVVKRCAAMRMLQFRGHGGARYGRGAGGRHGRQESIPREAVMRIAAVAAKIRCTIEDSESARCGGDLGCPAGEGGGGGEAVGERWAGLGLDLFVLSICCRLLEGLGEAKEAKAKEDARPAGCWRELDALLDALRACLAQSRLASPAAPPPPPLGAGGGAENAMHVDGVGAGEEGRGEREGGEDDGEVEGMDAVMRVLECAAEGKGVQVGGREWEEALLQAVCRFWPRAPQVPQSMSIACVNRTSVLMMAVRASLCL